MLYTSHNRPFKHHVHPSLQRRIRIFLVLGGFMLVVLVRDIYAGVIGVPFALGSLVAGSIVGFFTSRILHLSWNRDGQYVISRVDTFGWIVLGGYIVFEIIRASLFESVIHTGYDSTAITFAFVSSALISRVFGLRGRILKILKEERVFG